MIQCQLKLQPTARQERQFNHWLWHLAAVWNRTIRKIEQDANDKIYHTKYSLQALLVGHGRKIGVPQDAIDGTVVTAHDAWTRCFKKLARRPRLKGQHNRLNSIAFGHGRPRISEGRVLVPTLGRVRFHKQEIPEGHVSQMRIVKRASGWYLCLFIKAEAAPIPRVASGRIGIDPGFKDLLALSTGEKIDHPRELEVSALRLAQAQRGNDRKLTGRLHERIANQRKDRNHKLSRRLVSENVFIAFSKDRISSIARRFGRSVESSGHHQLRRMISYKSPTSGTEYVEPESPNSTVTCSTCCALTGPRGLAGLKVREWTCIECGTLHDRDINAAQNAFISAFGANVETLAKVA